MSIVQPGNYVTLAFYKDGKSTVSRFIRWITRSEHYSHVEIILGDVWVSALIENGVVVRKYDPAEFNEEYDYVRVPVNPEYWHETVNWINSHHGEHMYDFLGAIFGNMFHIPVIQDPNKWFCAEIVTTILKKLNDPIAKNISGSKATPQELFDLYKT